MILPSSSSGSSIEHSLLSHSDDEATSPWNVSQPVEGFLDEFVEEATELAVLEAAFELSLNDSAHYRHSDDESSSFSTADAEKKPKGSRSASLTHLWPFPAEEFKMTHFLFWALVCLWSIFTLFKYAVVIEGKLAVRPAPPPVPFFPNSSTAVVRDFYAGNGVGRATVGSFAEIVIVFYYAPWSIHSMESRRPYMEVASAFRTVKSLKFVAVNCHYVHGECRKTYKLQSFPLIVAYLPQKMTAVFNDPMTTDRLFSWVTHILKPIRRIQSQEHFQALFNNRHPFAVVGYMPFPSIVNVPRAYNVLYAAALKSSARDAVQFATIQNAQLAEQLGLTAEGQVRVYHFGKDSGSSFGITSNTKSSDVLDWLYGYLSRAAAKTVQWINPEENEAGGKSETLHKVLNGSSLTFILFSTSLGPTHKSSSFIALDEVVNRYYDCPKTNATLATAYLSTHSLSLKDAVRRSMEFCSLVANEDKLDDCCSQITSNGLCKNDADSVETSSKEDITEVPLCQYVRGTTLEGRFQHLCCSEYKENRRMAIRRNKIIKKRPQRAMYLSPEIRNGCQFYRLLKRTQPLVLSGILQDDDQNDTDIAITTDEQTKLKGIGCKTNRSSTFLAVDKRFAKHFGKVWNLKQLEGSKDALVAISLQDEAIYQFEGSFSIDNLSKFLLSALDKNVERIQLTESDRGSFFTQSAKVDKASVSIQRLSSTTFHSEILNKTNALHDSVVFFSGGSWHGPSTALTYVLHSVKKHFDDFQSLIRFYIIDMSRNSVPWQYDFYRLPALAFYPARRSTQSSVLPQSLPFTVPNVLAFILARCQTELRWRIAIASCSDECVQKNTQRLRQLKSAIDSDIRVLRMIRPIYAKRNSHFDTHIRARSLQRRAAVHLESLFTLLDKSRRLETTLNAETKDILVRNSLFVRWMLANRFGVSYKL